MFLRHSSYWAIEAGSWFPGPLASAESLEVSGTGGCPPGDRGRSRNGEQRSGENQ
jgi:hypothetical protein